MGRAELRRQKRQQEDQSEHLHGALKKAGFPEFQLPPAPLRATNLSDQDVANITGTKIAVLEQWRKEQTEQIRTACIIEAQEKLDKAEEYITLCSVITALKALDGFRYGKAAANYMLKHYSKSVASSEKGNIRQTFEELKEKWDFELEFEEQNLNKELGFDTVDWRYEYIGHHIPPSVYDRIWGDSKNIQSVFTQLAVIWELCEGFGFHKHKSGPGSMLDKFMKGTKEKYDQIDHMKHGVREISKLLKKKYDIDIAWSDYTQKTIDRFKL